MTTTTTKDMSKIDKHIRIISYIKRVCPHTIDTFLDGSLSINNAIKRISYHPLVKDTYPLSTSEIKQFLIIIKLQNAVEDFSYDYGY